MEKKKIFNKKAQMIDLQQFMALDVFDEYFDKSLFLNLIKQKQHDSITAAIKLDELSLLSHSLKKKLLQLCLRITDSLVGIDTEEKLKIRSKLLVAIDNSKNLLFIAFEFLPFSTKISIISDPGPDDRQTTFHVCGLIRETFNVPYSISIFDYKAYCFGDQIYVANNDLYNLIAVDFLKKVIANKSLKYKLNIELSNIEKVREMEINFTIEHLGLRTLYQVETEDKCILLEFNTEAENKRNLNEIASDDENP